MPAQSVWVYAPTDTSNNSANYGLKITPTLNQTGTASFTDIFINRTETAVGSGNQAFLNFQVGGAPKWVVDHTGAVTVGIWSALPIDIAHGGTGQITAADGFNALSPLTTLGDLLYGATNGAGTRLPGNTSTAKLFLSQTGTGSVSAAPAWAALVGSDLPIATTTARGAVAVPASGNLVLDGSGNLSVPVASTSTAGVVKVDGSSITISNGVLSVGSAVISSGADYYVSTNGSDSTGDGTSGNPWRTIQHAFDLVKIKPLTGGATNTINLADGTYTENPILDHCNGGYITLAGDQYSPSAVFLSGGLTVNNSGALHVKNFKINSLAAQYCGFIQLESGMTFHATSSGGGGWHMFANQGGRIYVNGSYTIDSTGGGRHLIAFAGSSICYENGLTITIQGTPYFSTGFCLSMNSSIIRFHDYGTPITWSGSATGGRGEISAMGCIDTNGQSTTWLPGNANLYIHAGGGYY